MLSDAYHYVQPANGEERASLESRIREEFARCHPNETLEDLNRRAAFWKLDRALLRDWMAVAAARAAVDRSNPPFQQPAE
jgi:hypothetical protein